MIGQEKLPSLLWNFVDLTCSNLRILHKNKHKRISQNIHFHHRTPYYKILYTKEPGKLENVTNKSTSQAIPPNAIWMLTMIELKMINCLIVTIPKFVHLMMNTFSIFVKNPLMNITTIWGSITLLPNILISVLSWHNDYFNSYAS